MFQWMVFAWLTLSFCVTVMLFAALRLHYLIIGEEIADVDHQVKDG